MTREDAINAMAREIDPDAWDDESKIRQKDIRKEGSLFSAGFALDAMAPHIQAERERVREMCKKVISDHRTKVTKRDGASSQIIGNWLTYAEVAIQRMDIGGDDG